MNEIFDCTVIVDAKGTFRLAGDWRGSLTGANDAERRISEVKRADGTSGIADCEDVEGADGAGIDRSQCVGLQIGDECVGFSFWPSRVHPIALSAAIARLYGVRPARVRVSIYDDGIDVQRAYGLKAQWLHRSFDDLLKAIQYIVDQANAASVQARQSDFLCRPLNRTALASHAALQSLTEAWASGIRNLDDLQEIDRGAQSRLMVITQGDDPVVTVGAVDLTSAMPIWLERPSQFRLADWPDVTFGAWCAQVYREAWRMARPRLDDLDCILKWPGRKATRHTYRRLLLPCRTASGVPALLGIMRDDAGIDLRATRH